MMKQKYCKGCQRILPDGYKHSRCENCRNKNVQKIKDVTKVVGGVVVSVVGIAVAFIANGKGGSNKS